MRPQDLVASGFDAIADRFGAWRAAIEGSPDDEWLDDLLARLPGPADILELGCGQGLAARRIVDAGHRYTGIDISAEQLRRARDVVPEAEFRRADFTDIALEDESLDAVVSLYVLNHLPKADLPGLLQRIADSLRPGGYLLATFGRSGSEGVQDDWLGVPMFFGSYTDEETRALLGDAGFELERHEVVQIVEPGEGEGAFLWVLARLHEATLLAT
ncbi:MAG: methyltransferase domain-containing protein [Actinomycetota bacterium]|nr:methyltransferase domain-containing protein [Actinomycetota bacterium]